MEDLEKTGEILDRFLQGSKEKGDSRVLWEDFHEELIRVPVKDLYVELTGRIYDLFEAKVSTDNFIKLVNFIASDGGDELALSGFGASWYEISWIPAVVTSITGGEEAIEQLLKELRGLQNSAQRFEVEREGYWTLAYSKILIEALALIRPNIQEEKAKRTLALEEVAKMDILPAAKLLAQAVLDEREQLNRDIHSAAEHKLFLECVEARTRPV